MQANDYGHYSGCTKGYEVSTIRFEELIKTPISETHFNFTCPPFADNASLLLYTHRVLIEEDRYKATFRCIKNYYPVSGDMVRRCEEGRWTGENPMCLVLPYMSKWILAPLIAALTCLAAIPYLCCDFCVKYEERRDLHFYRYFKWHFGSRSKKAQIQENKHSAMVLDEVHKLSTGHIVQDGFKGYSTTTKSYLHHLLDMEAPQTQSTRRQPNFRHIDSEI